MASITGLCVDSCHCLLRATGRSRPRPVKKADLPCGAGILRVRLLALVVVRWPRPPSMSSLPSYGRTPLFVAAMRGEVSQVRRLLQTTDAASDLHRRDQVARESEMQPTPRASTRGWDQAPFVDVWISPLSLCPSRLARMVTRRC